MTYYALAFFALTLFLSSGCKNKAKETILTESPDFEKNFSISAEFIDATSQLEITIHLNDSLHAYAPGEKIGKPVKLDIRAQNGWAADGPTIIPDGKRKKIGDLGESVVLEGDVRLRQKLKRGSGKGEALLQLQVCSYTTCDRPRVHSLPIISGNP
jgi:hypothetical protein